jgi:hypothetical protein
MMVHDELGRRLPRNDDRQSFVDHQAICLAPKAWENQNAGPFEKGIYVHFIEPTIEDCIWIGLLDSLTTAGGT